MQLSPPYIITPRLLPGIKVADAIISIEFSPRAGHQGRIRYRYHIDTPAWSHTDDDLQSGAMGGSLASGMESLLTFLSACAESIAYSRHSGREGENADLFPPHVAEWADHNSSELEYALLDLQDEDGNMREDLIEDDND